MTSDAPSFGQATIDDCEREPIHLPGSVQPHGAIVIVSDGRVVQCSANVADLLQLSGPPLGRALSEVFGEVADELRALTVGSDRARHAARLTIGTQAVFVMRTEGPGVDIFEFEPVDSSPEVTEADLHRIVADALSVLQRTTGSAELVDELCRFVQSLTGFDRVMGYEFQPDDHGVVIAEVRRPDLEPFLGLHYPASDIPPQARRLYLEHWLRIIPDAGYQPVPLEPELLPTTGAPLDMGAIGCRSVSPIHCRYLANMGVRASMSISLVVDGRLWGLVACHHYDSPRLPSPSVRDACELIALSASVLLSSRLAEERTASRLVIEERLNRQAERLVETDDLTAGLLGDADEILGLFDAHGAALVVGGHVDVVGRAPDGPRVLALAEEIGATRPGEIVVTSDASSELSSLADAVDVAAGVIALPLSSMLRNYLFWFRPRWRHQVRWAGEPTKAIEVAAGGGSRLLPRQSFAEWVESVEHRARPWPDGTELVAEKVRELLARHITRTAEELTRLNAELARSNAELDAFAYVAAHDLKEPLRGLANYAAFLVEDYGDVLDDTGREQLDQLVQLAARMSGLLGSLLEYSRAGRSDLNRSSVRLADVVSDVTGLLHAQIADRGADVTVGQGDVVVDVDLFTQLVMNLVSNAIKYNDSPTPQVDVGLTTLSRTERGAELVPRSLLVEEDTTVVYVSDNGIGIPADRIEDVFRVFRRLHQPGDYGGGEGAGLAISRRIVVRHGGVIWVESEEGAGCTFYFTVGRP